MSLVNFRFLGALSASCFITASALCSEDFSVRALDDGNVEICAYYGDAASITIPEMIDGKRVVAIGAWAFQNNTRLQNIIFSSGLSAIGAGAFANCSSLKNIEFPQGLTQIADCAFLDCVSLQSVVLPDSVRIIGAEAFALCSALENLEVPKSVLELGENAFPIASEKLYPKDRFPRLEFVENAVALSEPSGDSAIGGNEACAILVSVANPGNADAYGCRVKLALRNPNADLTFPSSFGIPKIPAGKTVEVAIPVAAARTLADGEADFVFCIEEPRGFGTEEHNLVVKTRPFVAPSVKIVDCVVSGQGDSVLKKKRPFDLQLFLQNTAAGTAEEVCVQLEFPKNVHLIDGKKNYNFDTLAGGAAEPLTLSLIVSGDYQENTVPVTVKITEKYGTYAEDWKTTLTLNSAVASGKTVLAAQDATSREIAIASFTSEIDKNIPVNPEDAARNRFVVIIANENYRHGTAKVDFALNDGQSFYAYCRKTLGVPESQIKIYRDATSGTMADALVWLTTRGQVDDAELIFYYSGHGLPDESTRAAYLLPTDTSPGNIRYAQSLEGVYRALGNSGAKLATVFIDACFSGMRRDDAPIVAAKGVRLSSRIGAAKTLPPNLIVFTAAGGDQTAHFAHSEKHGLFTYVLLKKIRETRGDISFAELKQYLEKAVLEHSLKLGNYEQTPSVLASKAFSQWEEKLYAPKAE